METTAGSMVQVQYLPTSPEGYCPYCSHLPLYVYHGGKCPKVKSIEYYPDGSVRKVEFNEKV